MLGGFRTFWGPIVGAFVYNYLEVCAVGATVYWQLVLGVILVTLVLADADRSGGHRGPACRAAAREPPAVSLLEIRNITKTFGDNRAVDDVTLTIRKGEFLGLIGSNGAGKTTLVNLISGFFPADQRLPRLRRARTSRGSPINDRIRVGIARSFQLVNLFDHLTVLDNVALTIFSRQGKDAPAVDAGGPRPARSGTRRVAVLRQFGLECEARHARAAPSRRASGSSSTSRVAYALRPKLLFLDEPTSGVSTAREGAHHGHRHRRRPRGRHHRGRDRARHGHRVPLLRPHRRHAPGRDPRLGHAGRDPAQRAGGA